MIKSMIFLWVAMAAYFFSQHDGAAGFVFGWLALFGIVADVREQTIRQLQQQEDDDANR